MWFPRIYAIIKIPEKRDMKSEWHMHKTHFFLVDVRWIFCMPDSLSVWRALWLWICHHWLLLFILLGGDGWWFTQQFSQQSGSLTISALLNVSHFFIHYLAPRWMVIICISIVTCKIFQRCMFILWWMDVKFCGMKMCKWFAKLLQVCINWNNFLQNDLHF